MMRPFTPPTQRQSHWLLWTFVRVIVSTSVLLTALISYFDEQSLNHSLIARSGPAGDWALAVLTGLAVLGVLDVLINDLLPERFALPFMERRRYVVYLLMAIGLTCLLAVTVMHSTSLLQLRFVHQILSTAGLAYLCVFESHQK